VSTLNEIAANFARLAAELDLSNQVKGSEAERLAALRQLAEACDNMIDAAKEQQAPSGRQRSSGEAPRNWCT
jgi:DnaJ-domain-containing protein 1